MAQGKYANANGPRMYYELHSTRPLVLLHNQQSFAPSYRPLHKTRHILAVGWRDMGATPTIPSFLPTPTCCFR